jgi:hypothetical protein
LVIPGTCDFFIGMIFPGYLPPIKTKLFFPTGA